MNPTTSLLTAALGLRAPWEVIDADFDVAAGRIDFTVGFTVTVY